MLFQTISISMFVYRADKPDRYVIIFVWVFLRNSVTLELRMRGADLF